MTDHADPRLCQVNVGTPNSIGQLPQTGPFSTVITDAGLEASLGVPPSYLAHGTQQPNTESPPVTVTGPASDAPGSANRCQWTGQKVAPVPPYYFASDLNITLSVVSYASPADAQQAWAAEAKAFGPYPTFTGRFALPQIGDGAHYSGPGPEDGGAQVTVMAGRYISSVSVLVTAKFFPQAPWIKIAQAVARSLTTTS